MKDEPQQTEWAGNGKEGESVDKVMAFQEILAQNPDDAFARYGLAMEYRQQGDVSQAMEQFDALRERHPGYSAGYQMAAQTLLAAGKTQEATERLHSGIAAALHAGNRHAAAEMEGMLDEIEEGSR